MNFNHEYTLKFKETTIILNGLIKNKFVNGFLKKLKEYNPETFEHSLRVGLLCVDLGIENKLSEKELTILGYAGLLHDVGKLGIPVEILEKDNSLSSEERKIINHHCRIGAEEVKKFNEEASGIIVGHHEYQREAYPRHEERRKETRENDRRKSRLLIKKLTQILSIADIYDALRNKRSYKKGNNKEETKKIIEEEYTGDKENIKQILRR